MKHHLLLFLSLIALAACNSSKAPKVADQEHQLVPKWETDSLLKVPESVLFDKANQVLYVSNVDGTDPWAADGKGSIGKVGLDGKIIAVDWVSGLDAPKGMGMYNGKLYVADLTKLVIIDIPSGKIEKTFPIEGAEGLNDISIDDKGIVYISDTKGKKVYRFQNDRAEVLLKDLKGPNGVLMHDNSFYVLDDGGMYKMNADSSLTKIADGMEGGTDGIENVQRNEFIVSAWEGAIWYINADGTKKVLLDTKAQKKNTADIGYDPATKTVYVPTFWKNTVVAYEVQ